MLIYKPSLTSIHKASPYTNIKQNIYTKTNFQRGSPFNITALKETWKQTMKMSPTSPFKQNKTKSCSHILQPEVHILWQPWRSLWVWQQGCSWCCGTLAERTESKKWQQNFKNEHCVLRNTSLPDTVKTFLSTTQMQQSVFLSKH